jgi:hypothetical protein
MKVLLAVEGSSDVRRARLLVDRWLRDNVEWFSPDHPEACRSYVGIGHGCEFVAIKTIVKLRREVAHKAFGGGRFGGPHPGGDAGTLKDLRILLMHHDLAPDVILWLRDTDGDDQRRVEAMTYIRDHGESDRFILGYAQQAGEAWVLVGWSAESDAERAAEAKVEQFSTRKLPRDAHVFPHHGNLSVKWVMSELGLTGAREEHALLRAWRLADAIVEDCGLAAFRRTMNTHAGLRRALGLGPAADSNGL